MAYCVNGARPSCLRPPVFASQNTLKLLNEAGFRKSVESRGAEGASDIQGEYPKTSGKGLVEGHSAMNKRYALQLYTNDISLLTTILPHKEGLRKVSIAVRRAQCLSES